ATARNAGLGSELLARLQEELKTAGCKKLVVEPGGYNSDPKRLREFYERHGFKQEEFCMTWCPK
ncbi:MAG TPA: GNAT family N-acetyltransferase, partial [Nitrospirota bacterium]